MLFNSIAFLVFAPVFFLFFFTLCGRLRLGFSLAASYFFYAWWDWRFLSLIIISSTIDYLVSLRIQSSTQQETRKKWLLISLFSNLSLLGFFKYFNFFISSLETSCQTLGIPFSAPTMNIILPVGISFYTFQSLSYTIDVYRRQLTANRDPLIFFTYVSFFPQLVAGPILRASTFLPQLENITKTTWANVGKGIELIVWGFFLKVCLADNAALFTDLRFENPELFTSTSLAMAVFTFALQIYGDFAGYSLIAIGLGRIMGYDFGTNFKRPYFATSFSDFWGRWHISLSSWIRDYLYIPLGGNKLGSRRTFTNLAITMFLAGLWHGAGWNFVVWGILHGCYLIVQRLISEKCNQWAELLRIPRFAYSLGCILTVFVLTCFAWIFFRANTLDQSVYIIKAVSGVISTDHLSFGGMKFQLARVCLIALAVFVVDLGISSTKVRDFYSGNIYLRSFGAGLVLTGIIFLGNFQANSFIYFQF